MQCISYPQKSSAVQQCVALPLLKHAPPPPAPPPQACTPSEALRASFPAFSLPTDGPLLSLLLSLTAADCGSGGVLLGVGGAAGSGSSDSSPPIDVAIDCSRQQLLVMSPEGLLAYQLPSPSAAGLALLLQQDATSGSFGVCADGALLPPAPGFGGQALLQRLGGGGRQDSLLLGPAVVFGARTDEARTARVDIGAAFVADWIIPCSRTQPGAPLQALLQELAAAAAPAAAPPAVAVEQHPAGRDAAVGESVQLSIVATPSPSAAGNAHRCASAPPVHAAWVVAL